jgi:hypothetical protein
VEGEPAPSTDPAAAEPGATVTLTLESRPPGALVRASDGRNLGKTPTTIVKPRDEAEHRFELTLRRHRTATLTFIATDDQTAVVELQPVRAASVRVRPEATPEVDRDVVVNPFERRPTGR